MKRALNGCLIAAFVLLSSACAINHAIHEDYPAYLTNNQGASSLPRTNLQASYTLTPRTEQHHYEFRSIAVGYGNVWIVEFGKILDQTLQSNDVQAAFGKLEKGTSGTDRANVIQFDLENYTFGDFAARVALRIALLRSGTEVFSKTYRADGKSQGGKMLFGGVLAMRNATQQSTKLALDSILRDFIEDVNEITAKR